MVVSDHEFLVAFRFAGGLVPEWLGCVELVPVGAGFRYCGERFSEHVSGVRRSAGTGRVCSLCDREIGMDEFCAEAFDGSFSHMLGCGGPVDPAELGRRVLGADHPLVGGGVGHSHGEGVFASGCPACVAQAAEDYARTAHLLKPSVLRLQDVLAVHTLAASGFCNCGAQFPVGLRDVQDWGAHVAAVWRDACTVSSVDQLDALPVGSVVMPLWYLEAGPCWKLSDGWFAVFIDKPMHPLGSRREGNAVLLVWHPGWEA